MSGSREGQWAQCQCVDTALCRPVQSVHDSPFSRGVAVVQQGVSPFCCPSVLCHLLSVYYLFTLRLFLSSLSLCAFSVSLCLSVYSISVCYLSFSYLSLSTISSGYFSVYLSLLSACCLLRFVQLPLKINICFSLLKFS